MVVSLSVYACSQCGYELVASAKCKCPNDDVIMTAAANAGTVESPWSN